MKACPKPSIPLIFLIVTQLVIQLPGALAEESDPPSGNPCDCLHQMLPSQMDEVIRASGKVSFAALQTQAPSDPVDFYSPVSRLAQKHILLGASSFVDPCSKAPKREEDRRFALFVRQNIFAPQVQTRDPVGAALSNGVDAYASALSQVDTYCGTFGYFQGKPGSPGFGGGYRSAANAPPPSYCLQADPIRRTAEYMRSSDAHKQQDLTAVQTSTLNFDGWFGDPNTQTRERHVRLMDAFLTVLSATNSAESSAKLTLSGLGTRLDEEDKLELAQMLGALYVRGYDQKRMKEAASAKGTISFEEIQRAAKNNLAAVKWQDWAQQTGVEISEDSNLPKVISAGVCRDIAHAQAVVLKELGMKATKVISYGSGTMYHASVITRTQDGRVVNINYGNLTTNPEKDPYLALFQGRLDSTLNYRIFDPENGMEANTLSSLGAFLTDATGFEIKSIDPLARKSGDIIRGEMRLGKATSVSAFRGAEATGASLVGGSVQTTFWSGANSEVRGGIALAHRNRANLASTPQENLDELYLFGIAQARFFGQPTSIVQGAPIKVGAEARTTVQSALSAPLGGANSRPQEELRFQIQGDASQDLELKAQIEAKDGVLKREPGTRRIEPDLYVGVTLSPTIRDVRDVGTPTVTLTRTTVGTQVRFYPTTDDQKRLILDALMACGRLGCVGGAELIGLINQFGASVRVEGRLSDETAAYVHGSQRRVTGSAWYASDSLLPGVKIIPKISVIHSEGNASNAPNGVTSGFGILEVRY